MGEGAHSTPTAPATALDVDHGEVTRTAAEASPNEKVREKTIHLAKSAVVTTYVTDAPTKATTNVANLVADTCYASH